MKKTIEGYTYKINEHIGKGYSSTVHKGINDKTGEPVSIKVIQMAKLEDPINQMLLQHEVAALKKLSFSPGVLHLYDVYATKNNTYLITELCDGDLGKMLRQRKSIPYGEAVDIIKQIINGYMDVYNCGYLHRDIKPANIFFRGNAYKIGDFGFAIPRKQLEHHKNYNVGSPVYMPPEALKDNMYSVSCDTWAIGIIFYQIVKGVVPWRAFSEQKLHQKVLTEPLEHLTAGLPQVARNFLARVLHLDPKVRMSVEEMVGWPQRLACVEITNQPSLSPLREIPNHSNMPMNSKEMKMIMTPKEASSNSFRFNQIPLPPPTQKHVSANNNIKEYFSRPATLTHIPQQQVLVPSSEKAIRAVPDDYTNRQAQALAENITNYLKFLHRVLKFVGPPCVVELPELTGALTTHLFSELDAYEQYIRDPASCPFAAWDSFLSSTKGATFKSKLAKCRSKYNMFYSLDSPANEGLSEELIKQSITSIMSRLEQAEPKAEKSIVAADYLTTLYQLWHLKSKHSLKDFFKMSKIDLIVEGDPYSVNRDHLAQLRRKLILIDIVS